MKQILQDLKDGDTLIADVPVPQLRKGHVLVRTSVSLVSAGTERMLLEFGKANYLDKARQQPDKVRMVVDKVRTDGLASTVESVRAKLDQPLPLGYSNVGTVVEVGPGVTGLEPGDRVVSNGHHAEYVCVPERLCAVIPDEVSDESASFTVLSAIALQGIRLLQPTLGENIVVTGLGLIGLITVQLLRANGCNVLGIDPDASRVEMAESFGALGCTLSAGQDPLALAAKLSNGRGVDGVIITASTKSNEPVHQAALMCRQRGRIVLVGVTGLELSRADFYEKELSFQVSCSYGPGRYDAAYEEQGHDYPFGFVRWTEQRNFEAVLDMIASQRLDVTGLVSHRFPIQDAGEAYRVLGDGNPLGIVIDYPASGEKEPGVPARRVEFAPASPGAPLSAPTISVIGAGNYATRVLIPALAGSHCNLSTIVSASGINSATSAKKYGFRAAASDPDVVFADAATNAVVIATRHDTHAEFTVRALAAGQHVFVEKPLALSATELQSVTEAYEQSRSAGRAPIVMLGFNRRFSPHVVKMKALLEARSEPKSVVITVNAGEIPADMWVQDPIKGGGRINGEACHFIDLARFLVASPIRRVSGVMLGNAPGVAVRDDKASITLEFEDGSFGVVHYLANGHRSFPKERIEVFCAGGVLALDNFRRMTGYGWPGFKRMNLRRQDKGNSACVAAFIAAMKEGRPSPIPFDEIVEVTQATLDAVESMRSSEAS